MAGTCCLLENGDIPPVNGKPVYDIITTKTLAYRLGCATSVNIWNDCIVYDELTINERQKTGAQFSKMIDSMRIGFLTEGAKGCHR